MRKIIVSFALVLATFAAVSAINTGVDKQQMLADGSLPTAEWTSCQSVLPDIDGAEWPSCS